MKNRFFKILKNFIQDSDMRAIYFDKLGLYRLPDDVYLKHLFKIKLGYDLNLENPQTLNEKLQWLKLYDRKPEYTTMVDKYAVKKYVADKIGEQYIIPTLGVWEKFDDINFDTLPNQFVLKCTHDSRSLVICRDKYDFDIKSARKKINKCLKRNYYWCGREWPYKNVPRKIIAEKYIECKDKSELIDYKIYTYGGKPIYFMYSLGEAEHNVKNHKFDLQCNSIDYLFKKTSSIDAADIKLPENMDEMLDIAKKMCVGTQHLRVDLYNVDGHIYFGEVTFYSGGGYINIESENYSNYLASLINIPILEDN